jgi:hypothetical protein
MGHGSSLIFVNREVVADLEVRFQIIDWTVGAPISLPTYLICYRVAGLLRVNLSVDVLFILGSDSETPTTNAATTSNQLRSIMPGEPNASDDARHEPGSEFGSVPLGVDGRFRSLSEQLRAMPSSLNG